MSDIEGLSVSTSTSGLEEASSFSLASVSVYQYITSQGSISDYITVSITVSEMDYVSAIVERTQTNEGDDEGLSTGKIIGIVLGSIFGLILILGIADTVICIVRKKKNQYTGRQKAKKAAQGEDHPEEVGDQHRQDNAPFNQI